MKTLALLLILLPASAVANGTKILESSMGGDIRIDAAPNGAVLRTMGGNISVKSSNGLVVAKTMGGDIVVRQLAGSVEAGTMGGNVSVEAVGGAAGRELELRSMGGSIELTVPRDFSGEFEVELEQDREQRNEYRIVSDIPLRITESTKRHWFRTITVLNGTGRSGSGANLVRIFTIGSDIEIRRK